MTRRRWAVGSALTGLTLALVTLAGARGQQVLQYGFETRDPVWLPGAADAPTAANVRKQLVTVGDILASAEAKAATHPLEVAIGRDIAGKSVLANRFWSSWPYDRLMVDVAGDDWPSDDETLSNMRSNAQYRNFASLRSAFCSS